MCRSGGAASRGLRGGSRYDTVDRGPIVVLVSDCYPKMNAYVAVLFVELKI